MNWCCGPWRSLGVLLVVYWFGYERHHFKGPLKAAQEELRKMEAQFAKLQKVNATAGFFFRLIKKDPP
jgi:hypothetical protein